MELQQLRYVVALAETLNFTRAAQECFVGQSALSHQIAALEREVGYRLFARTSRKVELTAAGEAFLSSARACVDAAARAVADGAAAIGQVRGPLRVGTIPTISAVDISLLLREFVARHPGVPLSVSGGGSDRLLQRIREGELDVAFVGLHDAEAPPGVQLRTLATDRHIALVPESHPLAAFDTVRLGQLAEEPFADFPPETPSRTQTDLAFAAAGLTRHVAFSVALVHLIVGLVREGLAVALLPWSAVPDDRGLRMLRLDDGPTRVECVAWNRLNPSPAAKSFVDGLG